MNEAVKYDADDLELITTPPDGEVKHKTLGLEAVTALKVIDVEQGIVEALVSCSNNTDSDGERFRPGAYVKWLKRRRPKGCHAHRWSEPVARTLEAEELMPGDDRLPAKHRKNGWGGLRVVGQYNLNTQRGRESFSDVVFFGREAEFSVGFRAHRMTDATEAEIKDDPAFRAWIEEAELYEWSDVLFGANPATQVLALKGARSTVTDWLVDLAKAGKVADPDRAMLEGRADDLIARLAKEATSVNKCATCSTEEGELVALEGAEYCEACVKAMAEYAAPPAPPTAALTITIPEGTDPAKATELLAEAIAEEARKAREAVPTGTPDETGAPCAGCSTAGLELVVLDGQPWCESCTKDMRTAADDAVNVKTLVALSPAALAELNA